ncbi:hypothetical protein QE152_g7691 [Popillia japonica]|uniref:DDE-1 domain-containing protein n=1 Tax=Popillia japonica TaxID=7064 RepID=A0AAW1MET9_POPJA
MTYEFAEKLGIQHRFSHRPKSAGCDWFNGFIRTNKNLSLAEAHGMNRKDIEEYFSTLLKVLTDNNLLDKPGRIYNMDEPGQQVNNKSGQVVATKGSKDVYTVTSSEKGENVTVAAYCNAEGSFLPPLLILKGTYKKLEFMNGLPPRSDIFMNKKSSYITTELFMKWFKEVFLQKKTI